MMYANASVEITMGEKHNDLTEIIAQALNEMKKEQGEKFNVNKVNLAELERRTGITRAKLRRIKDAGFVDKPHALTGNLIEIMIKDRFGFDIPVYVISKEELEEILCNAPVWWGSDNKEIYDNLIFIMPPATFAEVFDEIGKPKEELEKIKDYKEVVFWSLSRKDYQRTNWWSKTASAAISNKLTIRTANTVRKIVGM